ncbi:glycoside hydrolase family 140 protein [Pedobacter alpinus]|uniref:Glycoside hydrolase family 140 protein n=1 Tax=Pedobacter alpinus TaxID=1590643 RepID=A0ABW5TLN0_9SPHI
MKTEIPLLSYFNNAKTSVMSTIGDITLIGVKFYEFTLLVRSLVNLDVIKMRLIVKISLFFFGLIFLIASCKQKEQVAEMGLQINKEGRYFETNDGKPFFWLGDTGWLLFKQLSREEAVAYLDDRQKKGFNVIQVMGIHSLEVANFYGDLALINKKIDSVNVTKGDDFKDSLQYDYWDHVNYVIDEAAKRNLYIAFVNVWGTAVKSGKVKPEEAKVYANFLVDRFGKKPNIIWMNGGDIKGSEYQEVWQTVGETIKSRDSLHLMTFHPRGRTNSSEWFHKEQWLDFNTFQSGHRRYNQDTSKNEKRHYGEDNWKHVFEDYNLKPTKPTLDAEPSYEGIPEGLHDSLEVRWTDAAVRRYGYWSVFAGAAGFTYGNNAVMQFYKPNEGSGAFGVRNWEYYTKAINDAGAGQMQHLKKLMLSKPYFERIPDQSIIANQKEKHNYLVATKGKDYAFIYTWTGRDLEINMGKIEGENVKASWFKPADGSETAIGEFENKGTKSFNPPGTVKDGNDWVLILESI